ncbi:MAG: prohibitin family protein [Campylobacterales bacterium]|nr:prohibitin family protein [Campylobacterales bacterium]
MASDMNDYFNKKKSENQNSGGGFSPKAPRPPKIDLNISGGKQALIIFIVTVIFFLVLAKPFEIIEEGERGILSTNGKYEQQALLPGLHFIIPVIQKVYTVDTKVRIINYADKIERTGLGEGIGVKPSITVLDKRGLPVSIELTVQYRLNAQFAAQTISTWGFSWEEKIINPVVRDVVRNIVGQYEAESLPIRRNTIATQIEEGIRENVMKQENSPAILESVQMREIVLPPKVKDQIEQVQLAKQQVERAQQEVEKAKQEALRRAAEAQGFAEAVKIEAEGKATAITIEADAQSKANKIIAESLTPNLLTLRQIEVQGKFNEALSVNKDAKIFLTPGGSTPNIWVDTKDPQKRVSTAQ